MTYVLMVYTVIYLSKYCMYGNDRQVVFGSVNGSFKAYLVSMFIPFLWELEY